MKPKNQIKVSDMNIRIRELMKNRNNLSAGGQENIDMQVKRLKNKIKNYTKNEDFIPGGSADGKSLKDVSSKHKIDIKKLEKELELGIKDEMEHTNDKKIAKEIAIDHLWKVPNYYTKLKNSKIDEDAPANNVGSGNIGGIEPGQAPPGPRRRFKSFRRK